MTFTISSTAFRDGGPIPAKYSGEGSDVSPPLSWSGAPRGTKQWALLCDDPDAPTAEPWVHWVLYAVPADVAGLPAGVATSARLSDPAGAVQGANSWPRGENVGYGGPMPPKGHGVHHYHFKLYALDAELTLDPGLTKTELLRAIDGHVLADAELIGTYERK